MNGGLAEYIFGALILLVLVANLMYPGGWALTFLILAALLLLYFGSQFVPEYILTTNQGKNATKQRNRRQRRAKGLNPLSRFGSNREGRRQPGGQNRQQRSQNHDGRGGGETRE